MLHKGKKEYVCHNFCCKLPLNSLHLETLKQVHILETFLRQVTLRFIALIIILDTVTYFVTTFPVSCLKIHCIRSIEIGPYLLQLLFEQDALIFIINKSCQSVSVPRSIIIQNFLVLEALIQANLKFIHPHSFHIMHILGLEYEHSHWIYIYIFFKFLSQCKYPFVEFKINLPTLNYQT